MKVQVDLEKKYIVVILFVNITLFLNYAMANAIVKTNNGLIKIDKDKSTSRVDPVDATLCAFKLAYYHTESNYMDDYFAIIDEFLQ